MGYAAIRAWAFLGLFILLGGGTGCATVTVASAGAAVGLAASAIDAGGEVYRLGKLDSAEFVSADEWAAAIRATAAEMQLTLTEERVTDPKAPRTFRVKDWHNDVTDITVDPRTPKLICNRIDVGVFGSQPTARLLLTRIRYHAGVGDRPLTD